MNLQIVRMVDRWIGISLCAGLSLVRRVSALFGHRSVQPRNILVIQISEMGSVVLSYTMLKELKRRYPHGRLSFLMFEKNRPALEVLDVVDAQDVIGIDSGNLVRFVMSVVKAIREMRKRRIDTVLDLELFSRISAILSSLSGAANRVGFHRHKMEGLYRGNLLSHPVQYNPYLHIGKNHMALLDALASDEAGVPLVKSDYSSLELITPRLDNTPQDDHLVDAKLAEACPRWERGAPIVLLNPSGGELPIRAWPLDRYIDLTRCLLERPDVLVGVIGLESDRVIYQRMAAEVDSGRFFNLAGETASVRELIQVFNRCDVLVTGDSGPAHFASLSTIDSFVFFGPETPRLYAPIGDRVHCLFAGLACSPCLTAYNHRDTPCDGNNACIKSFGTEDVARLVVKTLEVQRTTIAIPTDQPFSEPPISEPPTVPSQVPQYEWV